MLHHAWIRLVIIWLKLITAGSIFSIYITWIYSTVDLRRYEEKKNNQSEAVQKKKDMNNDTVSHLTIGFNATPSKDRTVQNDGKCTAAWLSADTMVKSLWNKIVSGDNLWTLKVQKKTCRVFWVRSPFYNIW